MGDRTPERGGGQARGWSPAQGTVNEMRLCKASTGGAPTDGAGFPTEQNTELVEPGTDRPLQNWRKTLCTCRCCSGFRHVGHFLCVCTASRRQSAQYTCLQKRGHGQLHVATEGPGNASRGKPCRRPPASPGPRTHPHGPLAMALFAAPPMGSRHIPHLGPACTSPAGSPPAVAAAGEAIRGPLTGSCQRRAWRGRFTPPARRTGLTVDDTSTMSSGEPGTTSARVGSGSTRRRRTGNGLACCGPLDSSASLPDTSPGGLPLCRAGSEVARSSAVSPP